VISLRPVLALSLAGALVLSACGSDDDAGADDVVATPTINVGRTTEPISQLMAEIYGQGLENSGYRIGRKDPVADQDELIARLESDGVQLATDSTASMLTHLEAETISTDVTEQMTAMREALPDTLVVFEPAAIDNRLVVACSTGSIDELSLATISDLAASEATLGATAAFEDAASGGLAALNEAYAAELTITPSDDPAAAVVDGTVDCGVLPGLDPSIIADGLIVLEDDKSFAVPDQIMPVMTAAAGTADVQAVLDTINATLTTEVIRSLLVKAEVGGESYDLLAKQYLASVASDS
jgi:osmoprotectant transport system substrate-binding protein